jgi:hypothetical protein
MAEPVERGHGQEQVAPVDQAAGIQTERVPALW